MKLFRLAAMVLVAVFRVTAIGLAAEPKGDRFAGLADEYVVKTRPLMKAFCLECHSTAKRSEERRVGKECA